jgi:pimeloyl-ACP methyl ester carboxylesterase/predicted amino acid-binding ACT domain protein
MAKAAARGRELQWRATVVHGRRAAFAVGGAGLPVVFLHGWGLGHHAYQRSLRELIARGCRVYAPALPGFGGTPNLARHERTMAGYAAWVEAFFQAAEIEGSALVVGHSFGGGVAIQLAHDAPERVRQLVLINSVGSPSGGGGPLLTAKPHDRPAWQYGFEFSRELMLTRDGFRVMQAMRQDVLRNLVANPFTMWELATLARTVDLTDELADLRGRGVPILVLWSDADGVLPRASFEALCAAIGTDGRVIRGGHSWLLANPRALGQVLDNVLLVQVAEHEMSGLATTTTELRTLLARTTLPDELVEDLLVGASPLWLMSERPAVLAADLALGFPPLAPGEVRAVGRPMEDAATFRLTVVAADRRGLLADSTSVLAEYGLAVQSASVATWPTPDLALHALTFASPGGAPDWDVLGERLGSIADGDRPVPHYVRTGRASVVVAAGEPGRSIVKVTAPDGIGLLEAVSRWFAERGVSIDAAEVTTTDGTATDRFLVAGYFDPTVLAGHLSADQRGMFDRLLDRHWCPVLPWLQRLLP